MPADGRTYHAEGAVMTFVLGLLIGACAGCLATALCVAGQAGDVVELTEGALHD